MKTREIVEAIKSLLKRVEKLERVVHETRLQVGAVKSKPKKPAEPM